MLGFQDFCLRSVYTYRLRLRRRRRHRQIVNIVSMETDRFMEGMGSVPILPFKRSVSISTMLKFDGDGDGDGDRDGTCKRTLSDIITYV